MSNTPVFPEVKLVNLRVDQGTLIFVNKGWRIDDKKVKTQAAQMVGTDKEVLTPEGISDFVDDDSSLCGKKEVKKIPYGKKGSKNGLKDVNNMDISF